MGERQYHLQFDPQRAADVDAYLEYSRIVGDDDHGVTFTPEQYEEYKRRVIPIRVNNRLFTSWTGPSGVDCKLVGPQTLCFCNHRYYQHKTDFDVIPSQRPIKLPCMVNGCPCRSYHYLPLNGTQPVRCMCKHLPDMHSVVEPYKCKQGSCSCGGYRTAFTCSCREPAYKHTMIVETKKERTARGHPVGQDTIYKAMGGITGFSSLMEGYARLDESGIGAPSVEFLNQPITSLDHPFLRANVESIRAHKMAVGAPDFADDDAERISATRWPGESDMDYFERRYQERQRLERQRARQGISSSPSPTRFAPRAIQGRSANGGSPNMAVTGSPMAGPSRNQDAGASGTGSGGRKPIGRGGLVGKKFVKK
ncbi:hypothetical protein LSAT2_003546 [Lamellibrachia satsuma]|nr:hypothetical protein LSAT2_003546 [Lamellibrachia satsuma]